MVTANNYMFRPLTGHHQVVHPMKRVGGCTIYNVTSDYEKLHCILFPGSIPGHWGFFPGHQTVPCALGSTQPLKMSTRTFLGVKTAGA